MIAKTPNSLVGRSLASPGLITAARSRFIPCGVHKAVYILDGLIKNTSDIQPDMVHGDTHAQSAPVFALAHLLGIGLMPRIRDVKDLVFYEADRRRRDKNPVDAGVLEARSRYRKDHINRLGSCLLDLQRKVPPLDPGGHQGTAQTLAITEPRNRALRAHPAGDRKLKIPLRVSRSVSATTRSLSAETPCPSFRSIRVASKS